MFSPNRITPPIWPRRIRSSNAALGVVPRIRTTSFCPTSSASVGGLAVGLGLGVGVGLGRGVGRVVPVGSGVARAVGRAVWDVDGTGYGVARTEVAEGTLEGPESVGEPVGGTGLELTVREAVVGMLVPHAARTIDSATATRMLLI
jgi:hypothetical protein